MLKENDYNLIVSCLNELNLDVYKEEGFTEFINYRDKEDKFTIYGISFGEGKYSVATLFGIMEYETIDEVLHILRQDWNKENWIYGEDEEGEFISLKEGLE